MKMGPLISRLSLRESLAHPLGRLMNFVRFCFGASRAARFSLTVFVRRRGLYHSLKSTIVRLSKSYEPMESSQSPLSLQKRAVYGEETWYGFRRRARLRRDW